MHLHENPVKALVKSLSTPSMQPLQWNDQTSLTGFLRCAGPHEYFDEVGAGPQNTSGSLKLNQITPRVSSSQQRVAHILCFGSAAKYIDRITKLRQAVQSFESNNAHPELYRLRSARREDQRIYIFINMPM